MILYLTPLDFNFGGHTNDLVYEHEINTKGQLQKRVTGAANQIRKNPEMLNYVYENWYRRTQFIQYIILAVSPQLRPYSYYLHSSSTILHTLPVHLFTH
jgi:hypothetical protein